jgi:hypothetical protein
MGRKFDGKEVPFHQELFPKIKWLDDFFAYQADQPADELLNICHFQKELRV